MILGNCDIGENVTMAAYSMVIDTKIPADSIVVGRYPNHRIIANKASNIDENIFHDELMRSDTAPYYVIHRRCWPDHIACIG